MLFPTLEQIGKGFLYMKHDPNDKNIDHDYEYENESYNLPSEEHDDADEVYER